MAISEFQSLIDLNFCFVCHKSVAVGADCCSAFQTFTQVIVVHKMFISRRRVRLHWSLHQLWITVEKWPKRPSYCYSSCYCR